MPGLAPRIPPRTISARSKSSGLTPNTVYFYRFVGPASELSNVGRVKTAPDSSASAPLHFAFSGDNDGLIRPYALASVIPSQNLDFYINLGDVIYENASNLTDERRAQRRNLAELAVGHLSGSSSSLNGVPTFTGFATQAQLKADYEKKYRENFLPVNTGGQTAFRSCTPRRATTRPGTTTNSATASTSTAALPPAVPSAALRAPTCPPAAASMPGTTAPAIRAT